MKTYRVLFLMVVVSLALIPACSEDQKGPLSIDSVEPGIVSVASIENGPGRSTIYFTPPSDNDLLYIEAEYSLNGTDMRTTKVSKFKNAITVEGFSKAGEYDVNLYAIDLSENRSTPVTTQIQPSRPDILLVADSMSIKTSFGGALFEWSNTNNAALEFIIHIEENGELIPVESHFSGVSNGEFTIRGMDPVKTKVGVIVRDRWDNESDMISQELTPLFEEKLDKTKFNKIILDNDHDMDAWEGKYEFAYDDNRSTFNHTWAGTGWPQMWTLDLGVSAKLSRVNVLQRQTFFYRHGNPRIMEIWGTNEEPSQDGSFDKWVKLKDCVARRPSLEGGTADEDQEHFENGDEYGLSLDDPEVRYIRFVIKETWGNTGFIHFGEVTFYGQAIQ